VDLRIYLRWLHNNGFVGNILYFCQNFNMKQPKLYLAPLQGLTEEVYRNTWAACFEGIDLAITPFISLVGGDEVKPSRIKDVYPEKNKAMPVIPQVLGKDPDQFIPMAKCLFDLGYDEFNWNLGCPAKTVAKRQRGSGMLPFPERIEDILSYIIPKIPNKLSVKIRLGYHDPDEVYKLMPVFNKFPLTEIIIHPRIGKQMYDGSVNLDYFDYCLEASNHNIVYNGDIFTVEDYDRLSERYPAIDRFMLGRGVLKNPLLPALIKNREKVFDTSPMKLFKHFHDLLLQNYSEQIVKERNLLNRMKEFWGYFCYSFKNSEQVFKQIAVSQSMNEYKEVIVKLFEIDNLIFYSNR